MRGDRRHMPQQEWPDLDTSLLSADRLLAQPDANTATTTKPAKTTIHRRHMERLLSAQ